MNRIRYSSTHRGFLVVALAALWVPVAWPNEIIQLHSGNGSVPGPDSQIRYIANTGCGAPFNPVSAFGAADFAAARNGTSAQIVSSYPGWLPTLGQCPDSHWIAVDQSRTPRSVLYAIPFFVNSPCVLQANLQFCFAADDRLGDTNPSTPNPMGLYLTNSAHPSGVAIPGTAGGQLNIQTCWNLNVAGLIAPGQNWLYVYDRDVACIVSGVNFCVTLTIADANSAVYGCKFNDLNCNGIWDANEPSLPNWPIVITNNVTGATYTTTTGINGCYEVDLPAGSYSVQEVPQPGWRQSYPSCEDYTVQVTCQPMDLGPFNFGNCQCESGDLRTIDLSTGVDNTTGQPLAVGLPDDTWNLVCRPDMDFFAEPVMQAWVVPNVPWGGPLSGTQWISADPSGSAPHGEYCYETCFELCGCPDPTLNLSILVDDIATVYLNGIQIGTTCGSYLTPCVITITNQPELFRPGRNCLRIVVQNVPLHNSPTGLDVQGSLATITQTCCHAECPCATPPTGMTAWWPLDEVGVSTAADIAGVANNGTYHGAPATVVGAVGNARRFNDGDYFTVPHSPQIDPGNGPFSIDAWIRVPHGSPFFGGMIVSKTQLYDPFSRVGFDLYVNGLGHLAFSMYDGPLGGDEEDFEYVGTDVSDDCWHHVAVTVQRRNLNGVKLYVDGVPHTFPTALNATLGNTNMLYVASSSEGGGGGSFLRGSIDEVEFFRRALTPVEVDRIYRAGSAGKCRTTCYVPSITRFCRLDGSVVVPVQVCNFSQSWQRFLVGGAWQGTGPGCNIAGTGGVISPASAWIWVPPGGCGVRYFTITRPTGLTHVNDTACFCFTISGWFTGEQHSCCGKVINRSDICARTPNCIECWPVLRPASGASLAFAIDLTDTGTGAPIGDVPYRLEILEHESDVPTDAIGINGQPPGTPVDGLITLPPPGGGSATLDVALTTLELSPFTTYEFVLSTDTDGDGTYEPLYTLGIEPDFGPDLSVAGCENFDSYSTGDQVAGHNLWQGWDGNAAAGALTSSVQARSTPNSVAIVGSSDLVQPYASVTSGRWVYTAWQYVPTDFVSQCAPNNACGSYFVLLNTYQDGGPYSWSVQLHADSITNTFIRDGTSAASLPLVRGAWAQIRTVIDLDQDWFRVFYNGTELGSQESWSGAFPGQSTVGATNLGALDLFANQSSVVYYDDICLNPVVPLPGDMNCDSVVNFVDINPFVLALTGQASYEAAYPACYWLNADCNGDGNVNFADINPFVALLSGGG